MRFEATTNRGLLTRRAFAREASAIIGCGACGVGGFALLAGRKLARGGPPPVFLKLTEGVHYERRLLAEPRRTVVHFLTIDLRQPSLEFVVTPIDVRSKRPFRARTTTDFLEQHRTLAAINGDYFMPWHCSSPIDYMPKSGDEVSVMGPTANNGQLFIPDEPGYYSRRFADCTWYFSTDNAISTKAPTGLGYSAISGGPVLIRSGLPATLGDGKLNPHTAIALDKDGLKLWMVVVDGRQPGYSDGLSSSELTDLLLENGAWQALGLDGGGSSTMAIRTPRGRTRVVNSPIHAGIPGWQRPVANHLGIRVRESTATKALAKA